MASTSMTLGKHWEDFIKAQVDSGRYASASEVIRDALRSLEKKSELAEWFDTEMAKVKASGKPNSLTFEDIRSDIEGLKKSQKVRSGKAA